MLTREPVCFYIQDFKLASKDSLDTNIRHKNSDGGCGKIDKVQPMMLAYTKSSLAAM